MPMKLSELEWQKLQKAMVVDTDPEVPEQPQTRPDTSDILKDYEDELNYFEQTHPQEPPAKTSIEEFRESAQKVAGKVQGIFGKIVEARDTLYGYDKPGAKENAANRYKNADMQFLPDFGNGSMFGQETAKEPRKQKRKERGKTIHIHIDR